jgi:hypothetical protein
VSDDLPYLGPAGRPKRAAQTADSGPRQSREKPVGSIPTARTWRGAGVRFEQAGTFHGDDTFEPLQTLVAVKLRSDCMSVLVGVAVKPMSELR